MKTKENYEEDLASIRHLMERSSRFISLSGLSGILAGVYALLGATVAYFIVYYPYSPFGYRLNYVNEKQTLTQLLVTAGIVLISSLATGYWMSLRKAKKQNIKLWDNTSRKLLINLAIPLAVGAIFILVLISRGYMIIVAPASLVFYGLALINASHYTFRDIRFLGYLEILLGLVSGFIPGYGLILWALGFGVMHILYGSIMYFKYDR